MRTVAGVSSAAGRIRPAARSGDRHRRRQRLGPADRGGGHALPGHRHALADRCRRSDPRRSGALRPVPADAAGRDGRAAPDPRQRDRFRLLPAGQAELRGGRPRPRCRRRRLPRRIRALRYRQEPSAGIRADRTRQCDARCLAPDRRCHLRKGHRRTRRVLDPHRLHHRVGPGQEHQLRADGRRRRRLQPADRGALGQAAALAGVEPRWPQARLRQFRARQFLGRDPGHRHRRARNGRRFQGHQRCPEFLARRPQAGLGALQKRQPRDLYDGPGQPRADPAHQPVRHRHRADLERRRQPHLFHLRSRRQTADLPGARGRRFGHSRQFPGQLQRQGHGVLRRQKAGRGAG